MPLVSVVLTSFNHANFLRDAIDSVLNQTFTDFELIIWDDASTDASWSIIESYTDPRIKAYRNPQNLGPAYGVDYAIQSVAAGQYVAMHHSDDVWCDDKLEKQLEVFARQPHLTAVFTDALAIGEDGKTLDDPNHFYANAFSQPNRSRFEWIRFFMDHGNALCHPSLLIRAEAYKNCGVYVDYFGQAPDFDMWFRLLLGHDIHIIPEKLVKFRVRSAEANTSGSRPETRRQWAYERYAVLQHLLEVDQFADVCRIYPEAHQYDRGPNTNVPFALASVLLETGEQAANQLLALEIIRKLLAHEETAQQIKEVYGFNGNSFIALTRKMDVFSLETLMAQKHAFDVAQEAQITLKHQHDLLAQELESSIHQRELLIQESHELNQSLLDARHRLAYQSDLIATLQNDVASLNDQAQGLQFAIASYQNSASWRLTKPLRMVTRVLRGLRRALGDRLPWAQLQGRKWVRQVATQTGLFDSAYYLHENQDVRLANIDPLDHYLTQGWREGRNPSRKFVVNAYLEKNADIRWSGLEPLTHYLTKGRHEGRLAYTADGEVLHVQLPPTLVTLLFKAARVARDNPALLTKFVAEARRGGLRYALSLVKGKVKAQTLNTIPQSLAVVDQQSRDAVIYSRLQVVPFYTNPYDKSNDLDLKGRSVAVHLHLYYQDMLDLCIAYLGNIPFKFDLFVSVPESADIARIQTRFNQSLPQAGHVCIETVPNRGRDISPFIVQFGQRLKTYDYVGHFHTKKSPHASSLSRWFEDIMSQLCGTTAQTVQIFRLLQDDAKIVYPAGNQVAAWDHTGWSDNKDIARYLLKSYSTLDIDDFPYVEFPQGSMFWAKSAAIHDFLNMPLSFADFPEEPIEADATIAHALERLILILASTCKGRAYRLESQALSVTPQDYFETQQDFSDRIIHDKIKVLAYYLPQFHPTPENDAWHGLGFTEWHKVASANPLFVGHYQQHIPHPDIGYYHLESAKQLKTQADLMHKAGVHGMIFYHYWFSGKLILEKPAQMLLDDPSIDMPFSFCWANENWTRRWDGNEQEILLGQVYSAEDARQFIGYLIPFFKDPRYIKVDGRPVLFVYRPSSMGEHCAAYLAAWAEECNNHGLPAPYVVATLTRGANSPHEFGMDAAVERVLHDWTGGAVPEIRDTLQTFWPVNGSVLDYQAVARHYMDKSVDRSFTQFRSLVPVWDNTARYGSNAYLLNHFNPEIMQVWLEKLIAETQEHIPEDRQLVVVNAWNEWAEGAHLEPDTRFGYAYLNVIGRALSGIPFNAIDHLKPAETTLNLCLEPQVLERLSRDRVLKEAFISCMNRATARAGVRLASEMPEHQKALAKLGIACQNLQPGSDCLSWVFSEVMLFPEASLLSMLQMSQRHQGFYICGNLLNHPAFIHNRALPNLSVGYWARSGMEIRPAKIRLGFKVCPQAACFRVAEKSDYSGALAQRRKVSTIIRFHRQGDMNQLTNALFSLITQANCRVQPWLALQDLSAQEFSDLKAQVNSLPWSADCAPVYTTYSSSPENPDLRALMLNETFKAVGKGLVTFLDYDDIMYPEAFGYLASRLEKTHKNATFGRVYSATVDQNGLVVNREVEFIMGHTYDEFLLRNHAPLHSMMFNLDRINLAGISYHADMKYMEDYFLTLQIFGADITDWDSLNEDRFLGDYIHREGCDNHTLALADDVAKKALLEYEPYLRCEAQIVEMRRQLMINNASA